MVYLFQVIVTATELPTSSGMVKESEVLMAASFVTLEVEI